MDAEGLPEQKSLEVLTLMGRIANTLAAVAAINDQWSALTVTDAHAR
jgi:hypothetical protein